MKTLLFSLALCAGVSAQELTITLKTADGTVSTRTLTGPAVVAGLEVLQQFRADQKKYSSDLDAIRGLIVDQILALSERYPTTATAAIRAAKAKAEADLAAARAALEAATRQ